MASITKQITNLNANLNFGTAIPMEKYLITRSSMSDDIKFLDPCLKIASIGMTNPAQTETNLSHTFETNQVYWFRFNVKKITQELIDALARDNKKDTTVYTNNDYTLQIVLSKSSAVSEDNEQLIKEVNILKSDEFISENKKIDCIFTPITSGYNLICFRIKRSSIDYSYSIGAEELKYIQTKDNDLEDNINKGLGWSDFSNAEDNKEGVVFSGRFPQIDANTDLEVYYLPNLLATNPSAQHYITKIGLQARPGTTFSINGEELHMNKTGVYELSYPGLDIYHIAVVSSKYAAESGIEPFILNYTYTID